LSEQVGEPAGTLVLVHTVAPLVNEFARRCRDVLPRVRTFHILDEPLLERIRRHQGGRPEDLMRLTTHVELAMDIEANAVLVTCSTTSLLVESIRRDVAIPLVTIDEAMVAEAVLAGPRIGLVGTNHTTLEPSQTLIINEAARAGRHVEITAVIVPGALAALLRGDEATHDRLVAAAIADATATSDVVVLAQASMARATALIAEQPHTPVLTSPDLALREVRRLLSRHPKRSVLEVVQG
jgi:Asp/Glu/hydantoin racemase